MVVRVVESGLKWLAVVTVWQTFRGRPPGQVIVMFMGEYNHTIDAKGRVIVPSRFRETLGDTFVITKGLDGCLFVYDNQEWAAFEEKLKSLPITNKEARAFVRFFLAGAACVEVDRQGRILLPGTLRDFAALSKDVVLIGVGSRIEIWSRERWEDAAAFEDMDAVAEHMADLGLSI